MLYIRTYLLIIAFFLVALIPMGLLAIVNGRATRQALIDDANQALFAVAPPKDGLLVMGIAGKGTDPNQAAKQFKNALYQKHRIEPAESREPAEST